MTRLGRAGLVGTVFLTAATFSGVAHAAAAPSLQCGQVVTASVTLTADLGPCSSNGIVVGASGIVVNLNGHKVFGTPNPGDGAGVLIQGRTGVIVEHGTITAFDAGVDIVNGQSNVVTGITATGNIGSSGNPNVPDTLLGDGILIEGSSNNLIEDNTTTNNGPYSGIGVISEPDSDHQFPGAPSASNKIIANKVTGNISCRFGNFCDNDGIRLEPGVGPGNQVLNNTVNGNGLDGISLFADTDANTVIGNTVDSNGFHGAVPGDGLRVFSSRNTFLANTADNNAAGGVSVGRRPISPPGSLPPNGTTGNPRGKDNTFTANVAHGNGIADLYDSNPGCDNNVWLANQGTIDKPSCTAM